MVEKSKHKHKILSDTIQALGNVTFSHEGKFLEQCVNANITSKIFGYAFQSREVIFTLARLSKRARGFAMKHWDGALSVETSQLVTRYSPHLTEDRAKWKVLVGNLSL